MEHFTSFLKLNPWVEYILSRALKVVFILIVISLSVKLVKYLAEQVLNYSITRKSNRNSVQEKRIATVVKLIETTLRVVLYGFAILMILKEFGFDITPLLTGAGIAGVAVGFGAQSMVRDVITGVFILIEDQIRIGDSVSISGFAGTVERMDLRTTTLRAPDGTLHIIPNGEIKAVSNNTYDYANAIVNFPISYSENIQKIYETISKTCDEFEKSNYAQYLRSKFDLLGVTNFYPHAMEFRIVVQVQMNHKAEVERALHLALLQKFNSLNINLPSTSRA